MTSNVKEVMIDLTPGFKLFKDGTFERDIPVVLPSLDDPKTGVSSKDISIAPNISARLYLSRLKTTPTTQKLPVLVYFHGGAFVYESAYIALYHDFLNILVAEAGVIAVSVEYRLAPEHPLPAAYDDCWDALQWVASHALNESARIQKEPWLINHGDFSKLFINGDSAGANIAHNILMRAGSTEELPGNVKIQGAILSFPYFWGTNPRGCVPDEANIKFIFDNLWFLAYPTAPGGIDCPVINPLAENAPSLAGLGCSKLLVCTSESDWFRERGLRYVEAVKKSGLKCEIDVLDVEGEAHCFHLENPDSDKSRDLIKRMASFIINH